MKSIKPRLITILRFKLLFLLIIIVISFSCDPSVKVIENDQLRLVFAVKPVPQLLEFVQKSSQQNLLASDDEQSMFAFEIAQPEGKSLVIDSRSAKSGSLKLKRNANSQYIIIKYKGLGPSGNIGIKINGVMESGDPFIKWSIAIDNPGLEKITAVKFPYVKAVPGIGSPDDDFIVAPYFPGGLIENPSKNWRENYSVEWPFPGGQSVQFFSYQDYTSGFYLASMDTMGYNRSLRVIKQGEKDFILLQEYRLSEQPVSDWVSPYQVVLGVTSGTWQKTADIYKKWALNQYWCTKTLAEKDDIPEYWKQGPCAYTVEVRKYDKNKYCNGSLYPDLLNHLQSFRRYIDWPVMPFLAGWENYRRWTGGAYFPVFDEIHAKEAIRQIRKDNFQPFIYLSGFCYTFRNQGVDSSLVPGWEDYAGSMVIDRNSKPKIAILNESSPGKPWIRYSHLFCTAAPETKKFFRSVIDNAHALGIDIIQMDQTTPGAGDACYSNDHGHKPGRGVYQSITFRELLDDMRKYGKSLTPDFMLFHEESHEELIPYLDGFHTREYTEGTWYRSAPGIRGIPLFSYLYHEFALTYGGGIRLSSTKDLKSVRDHALNIVTGKTPGVSVWSNHNSIIDIHKDQVRMLRNHANLLKTEAQRFLMLGKMIHSLEFEVPSVDLEFSASNRPEGVPYMEKAVLTSSWQSPEGLVGHCLVNITDTVQPLHLQLDARNAEGWSKADIDIYSADKHEECRNLFKNVTLPQAYDLALAPDAAVFFVMRKPK